MSNSERVICVMGRVLDQDDGLGVYAENLLRSLARLDPTSRYAVLLRTPKHARSFADLPNTESWVVPARRKLTWDQWVVAREARRLDADLIFNPKFSLPLLSRRPGVMVLHGSDWYVHPENYRWWDSLYVRAALPLYVRRAARLLAISARIRDDLATYAGVDRRKVSVTYAAPSPQFQPKLDPAEAHAFALRHRLPERFMLAVARVHHTGHAGRIPYPGGNVHGLLHGYRRYRRGGGRLPLVIAGDGVREYLAARGVGDADLGGVRFLGFVPHGQIQHAYALAEFFVLTTLYESFGFPIVEAMACGCPVVAPTTGACPEIAGGAALLAPPRDPAALCAAMHVLESSPAERARLRRLGIERAARFSWANTARLTLAAFDAIAPRR